MAASPRVKPTKPYPSFPLTAHPNGQWCKKIRGAVRFFGIWDDPDAALVRYHEQAADLHAGRSLRGVSTLPESCPSIKDACNGFLQWQKDKLDAGEIGARWFEDCRVILTHFARAMGTSRVVNDVRPEDFRQYRASLARRLGVHALTRHLTAIRSMFKYAYESDLLDRPMKFGAAFSNPPTVQKRKAKHRAEAEHGKRLFAPEELRMILAACDPTLKAAVLLGINGGFGNTDCATLPRSAVDLDASVISSPRPKTAVPRVVPLWPETIEALRTVMGSQALGSLVFRTARGKPLVRQSLAQTDGGVTKAANVDRLSPEFAAVLDSLGLRQRGKGFYALRHTFRTWADETRDQHAIHRIMGHAIPGMSGIYIEDISLDRLRWVVEHVRGVTYGRGRLEQK